MFPNAKFVPQEEYKSWIKKQPNYKKITAEHILLTEERPQQQNKQNKHYESFVIANNSSNYYYKKQMYFINRHSTYEPIPYAEHIINEASKIANRLESSYIAIHWRMEGALQENLPNCARKLVKKIQGIRKNTGIKNVYLATDVPITCEKNGSLSINFQSVDNKAQSSTFHNITFYHIKALEILSSAIDIKTWKSLNAFDYLKYIGKEKKNKRNPLVKELNGPGVQGILDKLVCINSNYFLSGPEGCCRVRSSYTKQINKQIWFRFFL
ncbi:15604_t:CDS:2 [Entrophospora sp. SA101]|nr:15604_t:CDS:2 [Entrophospora sp. SA101]